MMTNHGIQVHSQVGSSMPLTVDIEFIVCWEDNTWETAIVEFRRDELPRCHQTGAVNWELLCHTKLLGMNRLIALLPEREFERAKEVVHIGIYHIPQDCFPI
jgi:hypothetical protein